MIPKKVVPIQILKTASYNTSIIVVKKLKIKFYFYFFTYSLKYLYLISNFVNFFNLPCKTGFKSCSVSYYLLFILFSI